MTPTGLSLLTMEGKHTFGCMVNWESRAARLQGDRGRLRLFRASIFQDQIVYFDEDEFVLKLHDRDGSGTLFGFEF